MNQKKSTARNIHRLIFYAVLSVRKYPSVGMLFFMIPRCGQGKHGSSYQKNFSIRQAGTTPLEAAETGIWIS
ncbi:hypothetical protein CIAN88_12320 [[Clostridium] innocuum]|uniref:Uncharacterized protein n=1 Tax=Clostridium innocuum TaxID=1522 RepID=A0A099I7S9_CLOIN|nr:hypothetical protein CIAN88_12320 [[Clostridium] innocuum]